MLPTVADHIAGLIQCQRREDQHGAADVFDPFELVRVHVLDALGARLRGRRRNRVQCLQCIQHDSPPGDGAGAIVGRDSTL